MPGTPTPNYAIPTLTGTDLVKNGDDQINAALAAVDDTFTGYSEGPLGSRPTSTMGSPGIAGREYRDTATGRRYKDTGTSWEEIAVFGGAFLAYHNAPANQGASWALVALDAEAFDSSGWFNPATGRYTPQVPGYYAISYGFRVTNAVDGLILEGALVVNGTTYYAGARQAVGAPADPVINGSATIALNGSTDYVQLYGASNGIRAIAIGAQYTYMSGHLVGRS